MRAHRPYVGYGGHVWAFDTARTRQPGKLKGAIASVEAGGGGMEVAQRCGAR